MSNDLRINEIKPALLSVQRQVQSLLADEVKSKRFMAAALVVASSPALSRCTPESIVQACVGVAMSDLNIDPNFGHCYLVPYRETAQLQIGAKGYIQLLWRAGWLVKAFPVFTCDQFTMEFNGWDNNVKFIPAIDDRQEGDNAWCFENLRGVYVVARHADTKDEYSLFVNKTTIEKLRQCSPNQKVSQYSKPEDKKRLESGLPISIWREWYVEMAIAKSIKRLAKSLPIGDIRTQNAIIADDRIEIGNTVDFKQSAEQDRIVESSKVDDGPTLIDAIIEAQTLEELQALTPKSKAEKIAYKGRHAELTAVIQETLEPVETNEIPEQDNWE